MKNLHSACGLPIYLNDDHHLVFGGEVPAVFPAVRRLEDMREVLADRTATGPGDLYFMYRDVCLPAQRPLLEALSLRFDLTVIRPGKVGEEYVKTAGHYHPPVPGAGLSYPEVYQVVHGTAHYLLQRVEGEEVVDAVFIEAYPGDIAVVPPRYGHVTINPTSEVLVMANWVERNFSSVYEPLRARHGAAYYEIEKDGQGVFIRNPHYREVAPLRRALPVFYPEWGLVRGVPVYLSCLRDPDRFRFLVRPQDYAADWDGFLKSAKLNT